MRIEHLVWLTLVSASPVCGGCDTAWDDLPGATLRPMDMRGVDDSTVWSAEVEDAAEAWNSTLLARGCPAPFGAVGPHGTHEVRLHPFSAWPHDPATAGLEHADGWIDIRMLATREQRRCVLIHELGHAIGLDHMGDGIMHAKVRANELSEMEVDAAAELLGCR